MNAKKILSIAGFSMIMLLNGCHPANQGADIKDIADRESKTEQVTSIEDKPEQKVEQVWEAVEWQDVVLQMPQALSEGYHQDTFQSADQSGELAGLELVVNTWNGEWDGGSYQIEYYEIMTDASLSTLINLHHARQLRKEYTSDKKSLANEPPDGISQEIIELGEAPYQRIIRESDVYRGSNGQLQKQWEFIRDPYNFWRLSVICHEERAEDVFAQIHASIGLKELPKEIKKDEVISWGDLEIQLPIALTATVVNDRFQENTFEELNGDYLYTVNIWEGEADGNSFVLTYYNVYSDKEETLFNDPYTGHILTYSSNSDYGIHSPRKREQTNKRTYTGGERVRVGDGSYSKEIYKSFGYMNADTKPLKAWHYNSNPCDSWSLEIVATREQAGELLYKVDNSIKLKEDKAFRCNIK